MFFDDPVGALRNLAGALRPRGRLAPPAGHRSRRSLVRAAAPGGHRPAGPPEPQPPCARPARAQRAGLHRRDPERGRVRARPDRADRDLPAPERAQEAELAGRSACWRPLREREADEATRADLIGELTGRLRTVSDRRWRPPARDHPSRRGDRARLIHPWPGAEGPARAPPRRPIYAPVAEHGHPERASRRTPAGRGNQMLTGRRR